MDLLNTKEALRQWTQAVVDQAKKNLIAQDKVVSGNLLDSLKVSKLRENATGLSSQIDMASYGEFIDKGVSGIKKKYQTPYSYKKKMPPTSKLDKWVVRRGIAPRDEKGRFLPRKSVLFMIARGIYYNGIKPSLFLTKPFETMRKDLPFKLAVGFTEDARAILKLEIEK
jgi:hypothetical protein